MPQITNRIRAAREFRRLTQTDLAKRVGVNLTTLSRWEKDIISPSIDKAKRLASVLDMSLDEIFSPEDLAKRQKIY